MANWTKITENMAKDYGFTSLKGEMLMTISALCNQADNGEVRLDGDNLLEGQIKSCGLKYGSDFNIENMRNRLMGLASKFPEIVSTLQTHDLNAFRIKSIPALLTEIRLS